MGSSLLRRVLVVSVILVVPVVALAQEAVLTGIVTDATMAVLPGVTIKGGARGVGQYVRSGHRCSAAPTAFPCASAFTRSRPTFRLRHGHPRRRGDSRRPDEHHQPPDGDRRRGRIADGDGGGAAHRNHAPRASAGNIDPRQVSELPSQGRNWMSLALLAPGNRTNDAGRDARAGPGRRPGVPAQRRRSAGDVEPRHRQPVPVQQRCDRGVSVHLEPVRRDAGPVIGRAGERHHQVGHQHAVGIARRQLPRTAPGTRPIRC